MARYIQKLSLGGREKWIGWDIDGVGTEIPGLVLAEGLSEDELQARKIKTFIPMSFDAFLGLGAKTINVPARALDDQDLVFRLDALQVGLERFRAKGFVQLPKAILCEIFDERDLADPRVQARLREWERARIIELVGADDCYLRIVGRFL